MIKALDIDTSEDLKLSNFYLIINRQLFSTLIIIDKYYDENEIKVLSLTMET